jgi:LacI family transcriptional regulator
MNVKAPVTLLDVAKHAGVSLATASRVINGSERRVSGPLREKVMAAATELHYVRNAYAQALARSRTSIVGIIIYDIEHPYFAGVVRGIQRVADGDGKIVLVCNSNRDPDRELDYLTLLHEHRAAAIIMATSLDDPAYAARIDQRLRSFADGGGNVAIIGRSSLDYSAVIPDSIGGMQALATAVLERGHRRVAVVTGPPGMAVSHDRLAGIERAFAAAGLALDPRAVVAGDLHRESGHAAVDELFARGFEPTAIMAANDEMAFGVIGALRRRGLRVPEDVSVTGFDDIPLAGDFDPALSTVRVPLDEIGERVMRLALDDENVVRESVPTHLVMRASTGAPRA